jgi:FMN phosphatase YigB (HAD superfamily)
MDTQPKRELVFLLDVDNTLLDNDRVKADIAARLSEILPHEAAKRFWELYEEARSEHGVVSYPMTLKKFAAVYKDKAAVQKVSDLINKWPYAQYLFPGTMPAIRHMDAMGEVAILSDGDQVYQPRKIAVSGLADAVGPKNVLIYDHKEDCFPDVMRRLPGDHYVLVDDKEDILSHAKALMGARLTTVWVKQGHYAHDPKHYRKPDADIALQSIGEICNLSKEQFLGHLGE